MPKKTKIRGLTFLLTLLIPLAACTYQPNFPDNVIVCDPGKDRCPAGYQCVPEQEPGKGLCRMSDTGRDAAAEMRTKLDDPTDSAPDVDSPDAPVVDGPGPRPDGGDGSVMPHPPPDVVEASPSEAGDTSDVATTPTVCPAGDKGPVMVDVGGYCIDSVGSSRVDLQACKLEYSIVSPK